TSRARIHVLQVDRDAREYGIALIGHSTVDGSSRLAERGRNGTEEQEPEDERSVPQRIPLLPLSSGQCRRELNGRELYIRGTQKATTFKDTTSREAGQHDDTGSGSSLTGFSVRDW